METFKLVELVNNTNNIIDYLKAETEKFEKKYPQTIQHFQVGETVYYINPTGSIVPAVIESVQHNNPDPGGFYQYWICPEGSKITIWNKIKFWLVINIPWINLRYVIPKGYPGHSVNAGDDIFKSEEEANQVLILYNTLYNLSDYLRILESDLLN